MKQVLLIDNYDSFTYNLVHYLRSLNAEVTVWRNDEFHLNEVERFSNILLSPGPGLPKENGLLLEVIEKYASSKNILGVCLGHQAIAEVFGGKLTNLDRVYHGESSLINITQPDDVLFRRLPSQMEVGRYHSWIVSDLGPDLICTSETLDHHIMSFRHVKYRVYGVQFHPESILSPFGLQLIQNWLESCT